MMNKVRVIGIILLVVGIIIQFTMENDLIDFISAVGIGVGIELIMTGKVVKPSM
ncbi:hypothetical protein [Gelidibacter maritimus]|uniref:Uncharacterized protein n=1 Tax=Gelidibacter maritimus TaxID=2761487 RepID=A0A7W2R3T8_9FLAO|nr:hypothetical protein [Gelidibacter maritimus]MBA6153191.1 hypothetical protein [Gelidibacter maritimus]